MVNKIKKRLAALLDRIGKAAGHQEIIDSSRYSPGLKVAQTELFLRYQSWARSGKPLPDIGDTGYRVCSQFDEDGLLVFIFATIGTHSKCFVDIGSSDGFIFNNCANLAINFGWHGLFIDRNSSSIDRGERFYKNHPDTSYYPPKFVCDMVKTSNINDLIGSAGIKGEIDFLSIDVDGNDYWIWNALEIIQPRVVMIETNTLYGHRNIVVPYDDDHVYPGENPNYFGASPRAMVELAQKKGYRLIGSNLYGINTIYVKTGIASDLLPTKKVEDILSHPRNEGSSDLFETVKDMPYLRG